MESNPDIVGRAASPGHLAGAVGAGRRWYAGGPGPRRAGRKGEVMLTGKQVRVRYARNRIIPCYLDGRDPALVEAAERLLDLFRGKEGKTRGELLEDVRETFGDDPRQLIHQGLAKLLEDRC